MLDGTQSVGPGDRFVARAIRSAGVPAVTALNKVDRLDRPKTAAALTAAADLEVPGELFPVSARAGTGVEALVDHLSRLLPEGPFLYAADDRSDQPERVLVARAGARAGAAAHAAGAAARRGGGGGGAGRARRRPRGRGGPAWVESDSQAAILIGAGGAMVKAIGTAARPQIEAALGRRVHLDLRVRVRKGWRRDDSLLDRLGIE